MKEFTELDVWMECRKLVNMIFSVSKEFPNQIRRSTVSLVSDIAESSARGISKDTAGPLHFSRSSLIELEPQLYVSLDGGYIMDVDFENVKKQVIAIKKLLNGFINYHKKKADA